MAKQKGNRRISVFYVIYFACLGLAFLALFLALRFVRVLLAEYEAAQPKYVAQQIFNRYFDPIEYPELLAFASYDAGLAGDTAVADYLQQMIGDTELTYSQGAASDEDTLRYIVRAGQLQVGVIRLQREPRATAHGFSGWRYAGLELSLENAPLPGRYLTIRTPADTIVTVDGAVLPESAVTDRYVDSSLLPAYPSGVQGVDCVVYTVDSLTALPQSVTVCDADGNAAPLSWDEANHIYTAGPIYNDALAAEYADFVTRAVQGYAGYMQGAPGTSFEGIRQYFDPDSALYRAIRSASGDFWMVRRPDSNTFEGTYIGEFYAFSPDVFSCHISFTQVLHREGRNDLDAVDMTVFLHRTDNGFRIFEWSTNT